MIRRRAPGRRHLKELRDDIKKNGLRDPLLLLDGKLLDGRNGIKRRHLNESQRSMIAAKLETTKQGRPEKVQICMFLAIRSPRD